MDKDAAIREFFERCAEVSGEWLYFVYAEEVREMQLEEYGIMKCIWLWECSDSFAIRFFMSNSKNADIRYDEQNDNLCLYHHHNLYDKPYTFSAPTELFQWIRDH